ncbi:MAG: mandelate racemase/muconate lactonizing enzyme family protein [Planctomycetes bacterium]|nr:mandelate racemase/muconate lactonizing enzyme family protein [Planctomycetota bacterium]MBI3843611.1 mandelate racemase/muconate lactonizing enzyme family protein [Planctomycetota bacterium]
MSLKITGVTTTLLRVPLAQRTITDSQSRVDAVEFMQVRVETDGGVTGFGMNWSYTPGLRAAQVMVDENYVPVLVGQDPFMRKELVRRMFFTNHFVGRVGAARVGIAAVEFALWDVASKIANLPLWRYLGPARDRVKAYSTDGGWLSWSVDELVRDATRLVERGFDAVKIKLGRLDPREDYERIGAVRKALGPAIRIMTDVNCAWNLATARYWGAKLADHDVFWLEEPMPPEDVKSHAELQRSIPVPIAVGETIYTKFAFRDYIESGAVRYVQADATKLLGIDEWLEVAALASAFNLPIVPHTNVQQKLHVQLAAATPGAILVESCYESLNEIWVEPVTVRDGYYTLPEEPGVGLRLRDDVVQKHRVG